jgi:hypothetical protein
MGFHELERGVPSKIINSQSLLSAGSSDSYPSLGLSLKTFAILPLLTENLLIEVLGRSTAIE